MMAVVMLLFVTAWSLIPGRLASVFTGDHALLQMLVPLIPIAAGLLLFDSLSFVVLSALRALRDIAWPTGIEIGSMAALVPLALWMALKMAMGARGLVIAALASAVLRTALLLWRFLWLTRVSIIPVVGSARSCVNYGNS
jgi:MATE family multidrug resistance protein